MLLSPIVLAGCHGGGNPDAIIHYTQVGACTQADFPNGHIAVQPSQAIIIFNVNFVDNTAVNQTWLLDTVNLQGNTTIFAAIEPREHRTRYDSGPSAGAT